MHAAEPRQTPTVTRLFVYPLKGAAGMALDAAELDALGFRWDRRWLMVDRAGRFLSQREHPRLALVRTSLEADRLVLEAPGVGRLEVPLEAVARERMRVEIWNDVVAASPVGPEADAWASALTGASTRLVRFPDDAVRPVNPRYATGPADRVGFVDGYPLLLISEASLDELNRRLPAPVPMNRFRPSMVVGGTAPHAEDGWRRIRAGGVELHVVKPCARCVVTTTDQATGAVGKEPLRTLSRYRKVGSNVLFGQNVIHAGRGTIRVGDEVVLEEVATGGRAVQERASNHRARASSAGAPVHPRSPAHPSP